jgi:predicted amidohydrolase
VKIALAQMNSDDRIAHNLARMVALTALAAGSGARAVLFPENCLYFGDPAGARSAADEIRRTALPPLRLAARRHRVAILVGSYPERAPAGGKVFNTSLFLDERGRALARYRKIHLFDVRTPSGVTYAESERVAPGRDLALFAWRGVRIGLSICFDLRFPEQYRALAHKGAEWLLVPSAFTAETGRAHWHTLLRARAIENLAVVLAPAQTGHHPLGRTTFGRSLAVGPWGDILGDAGSRRGLLLVEAPVDLPRRMRRRFPVLRAARPLRAAPG